jgi:hypothetical protein
MDDQGSNQYQPPNPNNAETPFNPPAPANQPAQPYQAPQPVQQQPAQPAYAPNYTAVEAEPATVSREPFSAAPTTTPAQTSFATPPKPNRKKLIVWGIVAAAALLLIGGGALAYNVWYQNPQKVVTDGIINAIKAKSATYKGTLDVSGDTKVKVAVDGGYAAGAGDLNATMSFDVDGTTYDLGASALVDSKSDLYFKVKNIDKLIKTYRDQIPASSQATFDKIVSKVNDKWIKVSADELKSYSEDASKAQTCMTDTYKKFQDDKKANAEIGDIYKKHQFIKIDKKLGSKDGSLGYNLSSDDTAAKAFVVDFKNTQLYKDLHNCDDSFKIDENDLTKSTSSDSETPNVELWVNRWSHQITKLVVTDKPGSTSKTKGTMVIEPVFNAPVTITTPKDASSLKDVTADIQSMFESAYSTSYYDDTTTSDFGSSTSGAL